MGKGADMGTSGTLSPSIEKVDSSPPSLINNFIDGAFVPSASNKYSVNLNPTSGEEICQVALSTAEDVEKAVASSVAASKDWAQKTVFERRKIVKKLAKVLIESAEVFSKAESKLVVVVIL
ncbi:hypothetical protein PPROV_000414400 [Pycnococcus provasolii]|uniref:Aldehyde dehydrogenase domain-containing protein n=1 Tax=Pycnococcus provasolii TaxID=41880 RepID=A0A830HFW1_9CHLO|nr:hypothetical protein PPROV_000414400 [Pycnococcus provasolii]